MHVLILGPTGTAGSTLLKYALEDPRVDRVTTLHRRKTNVQHERLNEVIHVDFSDYKGLHNLFVTVDVCFFCLGISQLKEKNRERFFQITHDYPVALAKALLPANPSVVLCFLSGQGADPSGKSRVAFAKAKGAAENSLSNLGLAQLYIFRPGYIHPDNPRPERPIGERISGFLYPILRYLFPTFIIRAEQLAKGMIEAGLKAVHKNEKGVPIVFHNQDIKKLTKG
jgi:uncharacterized protein YbjT (DUF2867 family)